MRAMRAPGGRSRKEGTRELIGSACITRDCYYTRLTNRTAKCSLNPGARDNSVVASSVLIAVMFKDKSTQKGWYDHFRANLQKSKT